MNLFQKTFFHLSSAAVAWISIFIIGLIWSGIHPAERVTWWLEIAPALIGVPVLALVYPRIRFTPLVYWLILIHVIILMIGGKYTYAEVPFGNWLREFLHLARNPYDRIGHFVQGLVPALIAREVLLRKTPLLRGKMVNFLAICFCLAFSAFYEITECLTALIMGHGADAFLGTQGDPWDTQMDMLTALVGAIVSLLLFARLQDKQMSRIQNDRISNSMSGMG